MHRLWFSTGGSAGHSCLVGLDVFEGVFDPGGKPREWNVNVVKPGTVSLRDSVRTLDALGFLADADSCDFSCE